MKKIFINGKLCKVEFHEFNRKEILGVYDKALGTFVSP